MAISFPPMSWRLGRLVGRVLGLIVGAIAGRKFKRTRVLDHDAINHCIVDLKILLNGMDKAFDALWQKAEFLRARSPSTEGLIIRETGSASLGEENLILHNIINVKLRLGRLLEDIHVLIPWLTATKPENSQPSGSEVSIK